MHLSEHIQFTHMFAPAVGPTRNPNLPRKTFSGIDGFVQRPSNSSCWAPASSRAWVANSDRGNSKDWPKICMSPEVLNDISIEKVVIGIP